MADGENDSEINSVDMLPTSNTPLNRQMSAHPDMSHSNVEPNGSGTSSASELPTSQPPIPVQHATEFRSASSPSLQNSDISNQHANNRPSLQPTSAKWKKAALILLSVVSVLILIGLTAVVMYLLMNKSNPTESVGLSTGGINKDLVVEEALTDIAGAISSEVANTGQPPKTLAQLQSLTYASQVAIKNKLVEYHSKERLRPEPNNPSYVPTLMDAKTTPVYHYQLCTNFIYSVNNDPSGAGNSLRQGQVYPDMPNVYQHKSGHVCYDLETYVEFAESD